MKQRLTTIDNYRRIDAAQYVPRNSSVERSSWMTKRGAYWLLYVLTTSLVLLALASYFTHKH